MKNLCYESTSACLLKCPYCISSDNGIMKEEQYLKIIDFIGNLLPERLVISGGEPLLDSLLKEKITLINKKYNERNKESYISISTSATSNIENDMWEFLKNNIKCFDVSIPTLNHDVYKMMRGNDLLDIALINIRKAIKYGLNVRLSIVITKYNINEIENILKFAQKIGVNSIRLGRYFPFRNATKLREMYEVKEEQIQKIINKVASGEYANIYSKKIIPPVKSLNMMNSYLSVDFNGLLFISKENEKRIIGNVQTTNIEDLEQSFNDNQLKLFIKYKEQ